tara:strand:+ start:120 stop:542 length:423 start_codon:yes stop_codon:yes gene_type:complete
MDDWLEELKKMEPLEIPDDAVHSSGYISEEVYRECSERMKQNNPMHNPDVAKKVSETKKRMYESGELKPNVMGEQARKEASERMKKRNPTHTHPEKHNFKGNSYVKGRKWYNNGTENIYILGEPPEGYIEGMMYKSRKKK